MSGFYTLGMSNNLKKVRQRTGLTQSELAEAVGTSLRQIAYLEKNDGDKKDRRGLNTEWINRIVLGFHKLGFSDIEPWMLVAEDDEIKIMKAYRELSDNDRDRVDKILFGDQGQM